MNDPIEEPVVDTFPDELVAEVEAEYPVSAELLTAADQLKFLDHLAGAVKTASYFAERLKANNANKAIQSRLVFLTKNIDLRSDSLLSLGKPVALKRDHKGRPLDAVQQGGK